MATSARFIAALVAVAVTAVAGCSNEEAEGAAESVSAVTTSAGAVVAWPSDAVEIAARSDGGHEPRGPAGSTCKWSDRSYVLDLQRATFTWSRCRMERRGAPYHLHTSTNVVQKADVDAIIAAGSAMHVPNEKECWADGGHQTVKVRTPGATSAWTGHGCERGATYVSDIDQLFTALEGLRAKLEAQPRTLREEAWPSDAIAAAQRTLCLKETGTLDNTLRGAIDEFFLGVNDGAFKREYPKALESGIDEVHFELLEKAARLVGGTCDPSVKQSGPFELGRRVS